MKIAHNTERIIHDVSFDSKSHFSYSLLMSLHHYTRPWLGICCFLDIIGLAFKSLSFSLCSLISKCYIKTSGGDEHIFTQKHFFLPQYRLSLAHFSLHIDFLMGNGSSAEADVEPKVTGGTLFLHTLLSLFSS